MSLCNWWNSFEMRIKHHLINSKSVEFEAFLNGFRIDTTEDDAWTQGAYGDGCFLYDGICMFSLGLKQNFKDCHKPNGARLSPGKFVWRKFWDKRWIAPKFDIKYYKSIFPKFMVLGDSRMIFSESGCQSSGLYVNSTLRLEKTPSSYTIMPLQQTFKLWTSKEGDRILWQKFCGKNPVLHCETYISTLSDTEHL